MKEFIEKIIAKLEEIPTKNKCSECPHKQKCDEIEAMDKDEQVDLCGATIKSLAIDAVKEIAEEYKNANIITDFLQYARDNADNYFLMRYFNVAWVLLSAERFAKVV